MVLSPLLLLGSPTLFGLMPAAVGWRELVNSVATVWLVVGAGAVIIRTVHLFFLRDIQTGLVWCTKIITDPFHDVKLYCRAPLYVMRGELFDPIVSEDVA